MSSSHAHGSAVAFLLRKYIPADLVGMVAERAGKSERTVRAWRSGDCLPTVIDFLGLMPVLGPAFANEVLSLVGMGGAAWLNEKQCFREVHVTLSKLDAAFTELGADGVYDETDRAKLKPLLHEAAPKIAAAAGRKVA